MKTHEIIFLGHDELFVLTHTINMSEIWMVVVSKDLMYLELFVRRSALIHYEGFWKDSKATREFPDPVQLENAVSSEFITQYDTNVHMQLSKYTGHSPCRICGCTNGSAEYKS